METFTKKHLILVLSIGLLMAFFILTSGINSKKLVDDNDDVINPDNISSLLSDQPEINSALNEEEEFMPLFTTWKSFSKKDGLPSNKANCVKIDGDRVLVGTDDGLAVYENGKWSVFTVDDGLTHNNILFIDVNKSTGDVWMATMSGLTQWSAGRFTKYTQFNSGLANDVIYQVACDNRYVWTATAAGASMLDTYTNQWKILNEQNSPMHEPWTYGVCFGGENIYIAAWGGGVIEYNHETGRLRDYKDPDHEMEIDLFPDDGLVHDITTGVSYDNGILWVGTYFGMSWYNGMRWKSYFDKDSGMASNFVNFLKADNSIAYICTDRGLSTFNGNTWITYKTEANSSKGIITIRREKESEIVSAPSSMANDYIWGADIKGDEIWVATANGVSYSKASEKIKVEKDKM